MGAQLRDAGSVQRELSELKVNPEQWRGAARRAARRLGRPVRTGAGSSSVWAALTDWPATEPERARHVEQLRRAVEAAAQINPEDRS